MRVRELAEMLARLDQDAEVLLHQLYGEEGPTAVTGGLHGGADGKVVLTDEDLS